MSHKPTTHVPRRKPHASVELYCRRDNRVYDVCPYASGGNACPCVQGMETADALFEIGGPGTKPAEDRGLDSATPWAK